MALIDVVPVATRRTAAATPTATAPLLPVLGDGLHVPLADGSTARCVNLDYAATAPALTAVAERVAQVLPYAGSVHRGAGVPSRIASTLYEDARATVARHLGARESDHIIFTRNTTDAINLLAACIPAGAGDVVTLDVEHHANLLPWRRGAAGHRTVPNAPTIEETLRLWLLLRGRREPVAEALFVHPQTVRYRVGQLRELFGEALDDPRAVADLLVALGVADLPTPTPALGRS